MNAIECMATRDIQTVSNIVAFYKNVAVEASGRQALFLEDGTCNLFYITLAGVIL